MKKHQVLIRKSTSMFTLPVLIMAFYIISINASHARLAQSPLEEAKTPKVSVEQQRDAPLRITSIKSDSATVYTPQLELTVLNTSTKPITAYAIRYDITSGQSTSGGVEMSIAALPRSILQPDQSTQADIGGGEHHYDAIDKIVVSVDFVEFTDGSTWGPDNYKSAEKLAGHRAGARVATRHLLKLLKAKGSIAVMNEVESEAIDILTPQGHSPEWADGFRFGIGYIQGRLKQVPKGSDTVKIEHVLRQPIDASDRRWIQ